MVSSGPADRPARHGYWFPLLLFGLLVTAAWYRWRDRRTGCSTPLRGYLVTGLVLAA